MRWNTIALLSGWDELDDVLCAPLTDPINEYGQVRNVVMKVFFSEQ